jgi:hypothetical protein
MKVKKYARDEKKLHRIRLATVNHVARKRGSAISGVNIVVLEMARFIDAYARQHGVRVRQVVHPYYYRCTKDISLGGLGSRAAAFIRCRKCRVQMSVPGVPLRLP